MHQRAGADAECLVSLQWKTRSDAVPLKATDSWPGTDLMTEMLWECMRRNNVSQPLRSSYLRAECGLLNKMWTKHCIFYDIEPDEAWEKMAKTHHLVSTNNNNNNNRPVFEMKILINCTAALEPVDVAIPDPWPVIVREKGTLNGLDSGRRGYTGWLYWIKENIYGLVVLGPKGICM